MSAEIRDPRFRSVVGGTVELERLGPGFEFTEGPLWHPTGKFLLFSDMPGNIIRRFGERGVETFRAAEQHGERTDLRPAGAASRLRARDEPRHADGAGRIAERACLAS